MLNKQKLAKLIQGLPFNSVQKTKYLFLSIAVAIFIILAQLTPDFIIEGWRNSDPVFCRGAFCTPAIAIANSSLFLSHTHYVFGSFVLLNLLVMVVIIGKAIDAYFNFYPGKYVSPPFNVTPPFVFVIFLFLMFDGVIDALVQEFFLN